MSIQTITEIETKNLTRFEKLWFWLRAIGDAINYDPQEQLYESHKHLNQRVERLQARVHDLERSETQES